MEMSEWDLRAADTYLAAACTKTATSLELGHPIGAGGAGYPAFSIWVTIAPDNPNEREEVIITAISGSKATVRRDIGYTEPLAHPQGTPVRLGVRAGAYAEDWRVIANFQNGWTSAVGSNPKAAYKRLPSGLVVLRGTVQSGTVEKAAFTLPGGYRPADGQLIFPSDGKGTYRRVDVHTTGAVVPMTGTPTGLDAIRFIAEA
jgi:hypothetical protein